MNGHVGDAVFGFEARPLRHVAVAGLDQQGSAQLAGGNDPLHFGVAAVIVTHEAHLHQTLADLLLALDDVLAVPGVLAQGLFAEAPLLLGQRFHHIVVMSRIDGGDNHGVHLRSLDHAVAIIAVGLDAVLGGSVIRSGGHIVGHGHHGRAGDGFNDSAAVILADGAAADDANSQNVFHNELPFFRIVNWREYSQYFRTSFRCACKSA